MDQFGLRSLSKYAPWLEEVPPFLLIPIVDQSNNLLVSSSLASLAAGQAVEIGPQLRMPRTGPFFRCSGPTPSGAAETKSGVPFRQNCVQRS